MNLTKINIAIDGPAGSGKSSTGNIIATKLNYQFIDTGLTYRIFTYYCLINHVDLTNYEKIKKYLIIFNKKIENNKWLFNNYSISSKLQTNIILENINKIKNLDFVRNVMIKWQKSLIDKNKGVVMVRKRYYHNSIA